MIDRTRSAFLFLLPLLFALCVNVSFGAAPTFTRDIAPLAFKHCAPCHRPGQSGPFNLIEHQDFAKRARQIREVVQARIMPPWLPAPTIHSFEEERRLTDAEIALIKNWVDAGAPEGDPADLPPRPVWTDGWHLGPPDLVVELPRPYTVRAEGKDTYRNFIVPLPITATQYVAAVEFKPGNSRAIHHAFLRIDRSGDSRKRDAEDEEAGFPGLHTSAKLEPDYGFFTGWQPGRAPSRYKDGMNWPLLPGSDLILQLHLQHTGKPEEIQPSVGFYFAKEQSAKTPMKFCVSSMDIRLPAGASNTVIAATMVTPGDMDVLGVSAHAHNLATKFEGFATMPSGRKEPLLIIPKWDFNWQGGYTFKQPVFLPKGTTIEMRWTYDNSSANPRNPHSPPQDVHYGILTTDEMAEFWLQVLPRTPRDEQLLNRQIARQIAEETVKYNQMLLKSHPNDSEAWSDIGKALIHLGRVPDAVAALEKAINLRPSPEAHYHLGLALEFQKKDSAARAHYESALKLNPAYFRAHNNLGVLFLRYGDLRTAEKHFVEALRLNPNDPLATENLELTRRALQQTPAK